MVTTTGTVIATIFLAAALIVGLLMGAIAWGIGLALLGLISLAVTGGE